MKFLKLAFIYKKHDTLRYMTFLYTKSKIFRKKEDNFRYVLYPKIRHLCVMRFFIEFLNLRRGWDIYELKKQCTLRDIFILKKQCTLRYVAIHREPDTMRCNLVLKKTFLYVFIYIIYRVGRKPRKSIRTPKSSRFVGIT